MNPNYTKALNQSIKVLKKYSIRRVPVDIMQIIQQLLDVKTYKYSELAKNRRCTIEEVIEFFGTDLGAIARNVSKSKKVRYIIYYNDTKNNTGLDRFTISHELGHYFLGHFKLITEDVLNRGGFSLRQYEAIEKETNCFARNLLSPVPLYNRIIKDPMTLQQRVMSTFDISYKASRARIDLLTNDSYRVTDEHISYFNTYEMPCFDYCCTCGNPITIKLNFCKICGGNSIKSIWNADYSSEYIWELKYVGDIKNFGRRNYMFYEGIGVDENSKAVICPTCDNQQIDEGEHCRICGEHLVNRCTNVDHYNRSDFDGPICGALLQGNARYCSHCGNPSTFLQNSLLKPWDKVKSGNEILQFLEIEELATYEIDDDDDDDLPF
ncbi:ImmA/IrrE family metallo-endopeptidase [Alkalibaculum sp. M08DMB]|uniref:ImmA/IrrE family metallo-endopeptidase n=1 Tax=Alkalibaculum sporogenes TaxID=2655001 RepID=A0A6A7K9B0_9FIRM|nr:ImmA/IrrE family metallo-endopeptidase [Alkalibaculum sporogenes]MPW25982.1 ImmA/IrrE family metallo-endopeptidase [Alkalibaculum sporogenes]